MRLEPLSNRSLVFCLTGLLLQFLSCGTKSRAEEEPGNESDTSSVSDVQELVDSTFPADVSDLSSRGDVDGEGRDVDGLVVESCAPVSGANHFCKVDFTAVAPATASGDDEVEHAKLRYCATYADDASTFDSATEYLALLRYTNNECVSMLPHILTYSLCATAGVEELKLRMGLHVVCCTGDPESAGLRPFQEYVRVPKVLGIVTGVEAVAEEVVFSTDAWDCWGGRWRNE